MWAFTCAMKTNLYFVQFRNQTCSRCGHRLEEELYPQNKIHQLELKIKILENEKRHREIEITELRDENERLKACEPFEAHVNKLDQHIDNFSRELEDIKGPLTDFRALLRKWNVTSGNWRHHILSWPETSRRPKKVDNNLPTVLIIVVLKL